MTTYSIVQPVKFPIVVFCEKVSLNCLLGASEHTVWLVILKDSTVPGETFTTVISWCDFVVSIPLLELVHRILQTHFMIIVLLLN